MRRIAIWSAKGGCGKTTVAANLAVAFARRSRRVLLLDLDPQACLLRAFGEEAAATLHPIMTGGAQLAECVRPTERGGVHLVAASPDLDTEEQLRTLGPGAEQLLDRSLEALDPQLWDLLLLDCPPGVNRLAVSALVAAREHLAPVEPSTLSLGTVAATLDLAEAVRSRPNSELAPTRILLSRVDRGAPALRELHEHHPGAVLETVIPNFSEASRQSARLDPVLVHGVNDPALRAFDDLAAELLRKRARSAPKPATLELPAANPPLFTPL
ncbi:MAG: ParA family protein [Deltaproteobacteria bacterium]|nr:ParA family protein [Deltaproteobacteria bacterium]MBW2418835.1 ParA family protein [Deltaproteobacteria bacterium]